MRSKLSFSDIFYPVALLVLAIMLNGCAGLQSAQTPDLMLEGSHLFGVTRVAFSSDEQRIISGGFKGDVATWSVPEGRLLNRIKLHNDFIVGLQWISPDQALVASEDGGLAVVDPVKEGVIWKQKIASGIAGAAFMRSSELIVAGGLDGALYVFSSPAYQLVKKVDLQSPVVSMAPDRKGMKLAVAVEDNRVILFDDTLDNRQELESTEKNVLALSFSHDNSELAGGAWYSVYYWDLSSGKLRQQETEHWGAVISIDFTPDDSKVITLGRHTDANLRLVDSRSGEVKRRLQGHRLCGASVSVSPSGRYVVSGSDDETIRLYDIIKPYQPVKPSHNW